MNINEKKSFDVIVIGGGAAGMMAAITAASNGADTMILEHKDRVGKKVLTRRFLFLKNLVFIQKAGMVTIIRRASRRHLY